jgi:hypothetical protein
VKHVTITIGDTDIEDLKKIFENESSFRPQMREDFLIIEILRQVLYNPKTETERYMDL